MVLRFAVDAEGKAVEPFTIDAAQSSTLLERLAVAAEEYLQDSRFVSRTPYKKTLTASFVFEFAPCGTLTHSSVHHYTISLCREVRGYRPSEEQRAQLIRALGRNLPLSPERFDSISADAGSSLAPPPNAPERATVTTAEPREQIAGKLLDHKRDAYRHDPNEDPSYFVRLKTRDGVREIWGKDIERAVAKSLTQPQIGDEIVLQRTGRDAVTVKRQGRDSEGQFRSKNVVVFRNRWVSKNRTSFAARAAAARIVRDEGITAREAVRERPELAGTYLNLRAAELASRALLTTALENLGADTIETATRDRRLYSVATACHGRRDQGKHL